MSSPFAITAATNTVLLLDKNRQEQTSFTVSNMTGHAIRGRAHIVAQQTTAASWLTLVGEAERDFVSTGSQQYLVQISVPLDAPGGDYTMRLDMVNVANPDDDFSEGPTVRFVVPAPIPVKKAFPWWIVALIVGALIIIGGGIYGIVRLTQNTTSPVAQYDGTWVNIDPNTNGITRLIITHNGQTITVHGFGKCSPTDCDWNTRSGNFNGSPFVILFDFGGGLTHQLTISLNADGTQLQVVDVGSSSGTHTYFFHKA